MSIHFVSICTHSVGRLGDGTLNTTTAKTEKNIGESKILMWLEKNEQHTAHTHVQIAKHIKNLNYFQFTPQHSEISSFIIYFFQRCFFFCAVVVIRGVVFRFAVIISFYVPYFWAKVNPLAIISYIRNNFFTDLSSYVILCCWALWCCLLFSYKCEMKFLLLQNRKNEGMN